MGDQRVGREGDISLVVLAAPLIRGCSCGGCLPIAALARHWWVGQNSLSPAHTSVKSLHYLLLAPNLSAGFRKFTLCRSVRTVL